MSDHERLVAEALEAIVIRTPSAFSWFGEVWDAPPAGLLSRLQVRLYEGFFCQGAAVPMPPGFARRPRRASPTLLAELSAANAGTGCHEPGWLVTGLVDGALRVEKGDLTLVARAGDVIVSGGAGAGVGDHVTLALPKELNERSPGYYTALGDVALPIDEPVLRLYWNVRSTGAPALVEGLTCALNALGIAFRLKVLSSPSGYTRCDAGVLYVRRADQAGVERISAEIQARLVEVLEPATPAFTRRLAPGLGLAAGPSDGASFGMHRCGLLAEAVVRAHEGGRRSLGERLETVRERFTQAGLDLATPYLAERLPDDAATRR